MTKTNVCAKQVVSVQGSLSINHHLARRKMVIPIFPRRSIHAKGFAGK